MKEKDGTVIQGKHGYAQLIDQKWHIFLPNGALAMSTFTSVSLMSEELVDLLLVNREEAMRQGAQTHAHNLNQTLGSLFGTAQIVNELAGIREAMIESNQLIKNMATLMPAPKPQPTRKGKKDV